MPVDELIAELEARKFEAAAFGSSNNMLHAQGLHAKAAERFQGILKTKLKTYALVPAKDHNDSAEERFFLHQGYNFFYQGLLAQDADPVQAAEKLTQGALAFKRAKDDGLRGMADGLVANLRVKRTCWFCHREMQGLGLNTDYYPAKTTQYGRDLVVRLGQDATAIEPSGNAVAVCLPILSPSCGGGAELDAECDDPDWTQPGEKKRTKEALARKRNRKSAPATMSCNTSR